MNRKVVLSPKNFNISNLEVLNTVMLIETYLLSPIMEQNGTVRDVRSFPLYLYLDSQWVPSSRLS